MPPPGDATSDVTVSAGARSFPPPPVSSQDSLPEVPVPVPVPPPRQKSHSRSGSLDAQQVLQVSEKGEFAAKFKHT